MKPLWDRVLVRPDKAEEVSKGGIVIAQAHQEASCRGVVVAVGKGRYLSNGTFIPMETKVGSRIVFSKHSGTDVDLEGEQLLVMSESDILLVGKEA